MVLISKDQAKRFILKKQLLFPPKSLEGINGIETVIQTLRAIQYDPLNPCGRNPDLVLQSRVKNIHPEDYYTWLYTQKKGIEVYDKELCIIPVEDYEKTSHRNLKAINDKNKIKFIKTHQSEIAQIVEQIEKYGPITASDIKLNKHVESGWGTKAQIGRIALEILWKMGRLIVVKRVGMKKYYDFPQNFHQNMENISPKNHAKDTVVRRIRNVGMLPKSTTGGGWQGLTAISKTITQLIKDKGLIEVAVKDASLTYLIANEDQQLICQPTNQQVNKSMTFIAPLDNLIWDRKMTEDLFDFHYRWEVYTPLAKRKFGYYVLPILYGDELIGRIEPLKNNKTNTLEIKGLWHERDWTKDEWDAFYKALNDFHHYLQTKKIEFSKKPNSKYYTL